MSTQPGESVEGITVPKGDPDALLGAGRKLEGVGVELGQQAQQIAKAPALMSGWAGPGSSTFADLTGNQAGVMQSASLAVLGAGLQIAMFADELKDAQERAQKAIVRARKARADINDAKEALRRALDDEKDAQGRMDAALIARQTAEMRLFSSAIDSLLGDGGAQAAIDAANTAYAAAEKDLHEAERREQRARTKLKHAEDDMLDARKSGHEAAEDARTTGLLLQGVLRTMPAGVLGSPGLPSEAQLGEAGNVPKPRSQNVPISEMEPPKDWPGWARALYKVGRGEATAVAGTVSLASKAYRHPEKVPGGIAAIGSNAYDDPLGTGKALIGYDDLANGRPFDWFGQAGLGALTGGAGAMTSRGARLRRLVGPAKIEQLGPRAPRWGPAFAGRRLDFSKPEMNARPNSGSRVTVPDNAADLAKEYPRGVRYTRAGYPVFTGHAVERIHVDGLTGNMRHDNKLANAAAGIKGAEPPDGYTWHHVEDGKTMELVPSNLHDAAKHTGGRAAMPDQLDRVTPGGAFTPFEKTAGGVGAFGGVTAGGPAAAGSAP